MSNPDFAAQAARLSQDAGFPPPAALTPLAGGRNNRVFRVDYGRDHPSAVLKSYFFAETDSRNRLGAEWDFLQYACRRGIAAAPRPLAAAADEHAALYTYIEGEKLRAGEVGADEVTAAAAFVTALNAEPRRLLDFKPASEACFSLAEHLATVDRRIARLDRIDGDAPHATEAAHFVRAELAPRWRDLRHHILAAAEARAIETSGILPAGERCVSPSDFGFHNAIRRPGGDLAFVDFEYAGSDDPAKLVCDFFCQPDIPAPIALWDLFVDAVIAGCRLDPADRQRFALLLGAYRIKWICIILNDFVAVDGARRIYAGAANRAQRCADQLALARQRLRLLDIGAC
jgi:hypothetical protein